MTDGRKVSRRWKERVARVRRDLERHPERAVCWLCGEDIDMALPYRHARGFTLDHIAPVGKGGDENGPAEPAHLRCNSSRGNVRPRKDRPTLGDW